MAPVRTAAALLSAVAGTANAGKSFLQKESVQQGSYEFLLRSRANQTPMMLPLDPQDPNFELPADHVGDSTGDCTCLNWRHVYQRKGVQCGSGREFEAMVNRDDIPYWTSKFFINQVCKQVYERIDDNPCVNIFYDRWQDHFRPKQWCYVTSDCVGSATEATREPNAKIRVKYCDPKKGDTILWQNSPEELFTWAQDMDIDPAAAVKLAYRVETEATWDMAKAQWGQTPEIQMSAVSMHLQQVLSTIKKIDQPVVIDSKDQKPPFAVVKGNKAWQIIPDPDPDYRAPNTFSQWACVADCPDGKIKTQKVKDFYRQDSYKDVEESDKIAKEKQEHEPEPQAQQLPYMQQLIG